MRTRRCWRILELYCSLRVLVMEGRCDVRALGDGLKGIYATSVARAEFDDDLA